jgi:hypothetical protein
MMLLEGDKQSHNFVYAVVHSTNAVDGVERFYWKRKSTELAGFKLFCNKKD